MLRRDRGRETCRAPAQGTSEGTALGQSCLWRWGLWKPHFSPHRQDSGAWNPHPPSGQQPLLSIWSPTALPSAAPNLKVSPDLGGGNQG